MGKVELSLSIDAELAAFAERQGVSLESALEAGLKAALVRAGDERVAQAVERVRYLRDHPKEAEALARQWAEENAEAIKAYKERIEKYGVFGDDLRTW